MTTEKPIVYLDNAATTFPKPEVVYQAMDSFYRNYGGNAGRGANPLARKASALMEETRSALRQWLGVPEIVFQPSATIALNTVILGANLQPEDLVYVTPFEHNSVLRPLEYLRKSVGIRVEALPFDRRTLECKFDEIRAMFRLEQPAMMCVSLMSNVLGLILPVDELVRTAKETSDTIITVVDGSQAAGLISIDTSHVDALIFSGHKSLYGPYGIAGIGLGTEWRPRPLIFGGTGTESESIDMPIDLSRFEAGSHNIVAVAGINASLQWLRNTGRETINSHVYSLTCELIDGLRSIPGVRVYIPVELHKHSSIVSFSVLDMLPQAIETALGAQCIAVRAGLHCAPWTHRHIGTLHSGGTVRVSLSYFSTSDDIGSFLTTLTKITKTVSSTEDFALL